MVAVILTTLGQIRILWLSKLGVILEDSDNKNLKDVIELTLKYIIVSNYMSIEMHIEAAIEKT